MSNLRPCASVTFSNRKALRWLSGNPRNCSRTSGCSSVSLLIGTVTRTSLPACSSPSTYLPRVGQYDAVIANVPVFVTLAGYPWRTRMRAASAPMRGVQQGTGSTALPIGCRVMRLVKPEIAAAGKAYCRQQPPSLIADGAAGDPFLGEPDNLRAQVIAHEKEFMFAIVLSRMTGELGWRHGKDQPSTASIDGGKAKHVLEKGPVGLGVARVHDGMHACNHGELHRCRS